MQKERDVGEAAETTRRPSSDHQIHGTTGVGTPHSGKYKRPISSSSNATESVAFDQWIRISGEKRHLLRVAQPDSCFIGRRWWRSHPRIGGYLQKLVCSTSHKIYSDAASQDQIYWRIGGIFGGCSQITRAVQGVQLRGSVFFFFTPTVQYVKNDTIMTKPVQVDWIPFNKYIKM